MSGVTMTYLENREAEVTSASEQISACEGWSLPQPPVWAGSITGMSGGCGPTVPEKGKNHHLCPATAVMAETNLQ